MLYSFTERDHLPSLAPVPGLVVRQSDDAELLAAIGKLTTDEVRARFANHNRAYVAFLVGTPAAFGWLALETARIGELNHEFALPGQHGYLWNFRTLPEYKGKGIYPLLLQYIINDKQSAVRNFWIMHAPENLASKRGIEKAGFVFKADVSLMDAQNVICKAEQPVEGDIIQKTFGFTPVEGSLATCWNCSSPYIKNKTECCCTAKGADCSAGEVAAMRS